MPAFSARACQNHNCPGGSFSPVNSSTFQIVHEPNDQPFHIGYVDGTKARGNYSTDVVSLGGAVLTNFTFGLANQILAPPALRNGVKFGIMGVSYGGQESGARCNDHAGCRGAFITPTIPDALYTAGYIQSRSYSLYLDALPEQKGSILFGGIDTAKFVGELTTLAVQPDVSGGAKNGMYVGQDLRLTSVSATINSTTTPFSSNHYSRTALLDTGSTHMQLPVSKVLVRCGNVLTLMVPSSSSRSSTLSWKWCQHQPKTAGCPVTMQTRPTT